MKKVLECLINKFAYKHPHLWLQILEDVEMLIDDCKKKKKQKMYKNVQKLIRKIK